MKTVFTLLMLPVLILVCIFFSTQLYVNGQYLGAYSLVATWFLSIVFWIQNTGLVLQKQRA